MPGVTMCWAAGYRVEPWEDGGERREEVVHVGREVLPGNPPGYLAIPLEATWA